jgi:hypothetical protein
LTIALNSFNRSMGLPDLYPFVLADPAVEKLRLVHKVIHGQPPPPTRQEIHTATEIKTAS